MTDAQSSCHGSAQRIRVEVALLTVIHMASIICLSRLPSSSTITGRNNLRCLLPPYTSPSFRSNLSGQDAKSTLVTNYLSFVALYSHLLRGDIYLPFIITPFYITDPSHTLFVIPNIGKSYVCLCGIQANNMSEPQDRATWRCLWVPNVFHAVEKCTPISEELEYSRAQQVTTHVHHIYWYPYITTCLALGVLFNPDIVYAYHSGHSSGVLKLAQ